MVTARLWSVLAPSAGVPDTSAPGGASTPPPEDGPFADRRPVAWSELMPSWPEDVELAEGGPPRPVVTGSSTAPVDPSAWAAVRPAWHAPGSSAGPASAASLGSGSAAFSGPASAVSLGSGSAAFSGSGAAGPFDRASDSSVDRDPGPPDGFEPRAAGGAFGPPRGRFAAFDPGRRGVKALAAVAVAVALIAAFLAWRARPQVDPVPPAPVAEAPAGPGAPADAAAPAAAPSAGAEVVVAVEGKVGKPGVVRLPAGARVADALAAAGGARPGVDVALLNLARKVVDGELILVGVTPPPGSTVAAGPAAAGAPAGPVNLNTATVADLDTLPGVGPVLAQRILDARTAQGGFRAVGDLRKVDGIGASRYEQLKDLVTV